MPLRHSLRSGRPLAAVAAVLLTSAACTSVNGILYHDVILPLDTDLNPTPLGSKTSELDAKSIQNPIGPRVQIDWDSNAIGDILRENGMTKGYFADEKRVAVFFGFFGYRRTVVSGD
jgi:hypothetical protein